MITQRSVIESHFSHLVHHQTYPSQARRFGYVEPSVRRYTSSLVGYKKNIYREIPPETKAQIVGEWHRCFEDWNYPMVMKFWDVSSGRSIHTVNVSDWWSGHRIINFGELAFSRDGKYLALPVGSWNRGGKWGELRVWNVEKQALEAETPFAEDDHHPVTAAAFSQDGKTLISTTGDGRLMRWDVVSK